MDEIDEYERGHADGFIFGKKEQKKKMIEKFEKLIDEFFQYCGIHEDWKRAMLKKLKQMEKEE